MYKKILLSLIGIVFMSLLSTSKVEARILSITPIGAPIVTETTITQNYMMRLRAFREWDLEVSANEPYWINSEDPTYKIPATNTEFITSDGTFPLPIDGDVEIYEGDFSPYTTLPFSVKVDRIQGVKSGNYTINLSFEINGDFFPFTMSVYIPPYFDLVTTVPTAYINLTEADVFNLNSETQNVSDTQINIKSNGKWELFLDTSNFGEPIGNYMFEVIAGEGNNIVLPNKNKSSIIYGNSYLIALGDSSYQKNDPSIELPTFVRIRYYLKNNTGRYFQEGTYNNNFIYRIQEK